MNEFGTFVITESYRHHLVQPALYIRLECCVHLDAVYHHYAIRLIGDLVEINRYPTLKFANFYHFHTAPNRHTHCGFGESVFR